MRGADLLSSTHASYTCKNNSFNFVPHRTKTHESANMNICKYFVPNCKLISAFPERRLSLAQEGVKTNLWLYVQNWSPITTEFRKYVTNTDNNISGEKQSGRRNYEVSISPPPPPQTLVWSNYAWTTHIEYIKFKFFNFITQREHTVLNTTIYTNQILYIFHNPWNMKLYHE